MKKTCLEELDAEGHSWRAARAKGAHVHRERAVFMPRAGDRQIDNDRKQRYRPRPDRFHRWGVNHGVWFGRVIPNSRSGGGICSYCFLVRQERVANSSLRFRSALSKKTHWATPPV